MCLVKIRCLTRFNPNFKLGLIIIIFLSFFNFTYSNEDEKLELVKEPELMLLFKEEKFVISLLGVDESCSGGCKVFEESLLSIREDLVEHTGGWVIRSFAPQLTKTYGLKGSAILFMREGRPLIYSGDAENEELLLSILVNNKISTVRNLTDSTFEHETQAGTGATTGDWLVMFTKDDCEECEMHIPTLETVAVNLKGKKNVAFVERNTGAVTARRFGVKTFPTFLLFRHGKLYRYLVPVVSTASLTSFAEDSFRNSKSELVPQPKSPFDDVVEAAADWLKENPMTFLMSLAGILIVIAFLVLLNRPPPESWTKKTKKKKH